MNTEKTVTISVEQYDKLLARNKELEMQKAEVLKALKKIYNAHDSGNNGAYMGEAVLCGYFSTMCQSIIASAEKQS